MSNFNLSTFQLSYIEKYKTTKYQITNLNTNEKHIIILTIMPTFIHITTHMLENFKLYIGQRAYSTNTLAENITGNEVLTYLKLLHEIGSKYPTQVLKNLYNILDLGYEEF